MTAASLSRRISMSALASAVVVLSAFPCSTPAQPPDVEATTQLLVKFQAGTRPAAAEAAVSAVGATMRRSIDSLGVRIVDVADSRAYAALTALAGSPGVEFAERDAQVHAADTTPNDPWWPNETSTARVNAPKAWDISTGSANVVIAVLDTGVDPTQPDLQGALVAGWDFVNGDADASDDHGHGTLVAGAAAARSNNALGIASYCWRCAVMPVKVMGADGYGTVSNVAAGMTWAVDHGARVLNLSLGTTTDSSTLASAVRYAHGKGAVIAAAAGNSGSSALTYPAAYPEVLGVAGTNADDTLAASSNYGSWVKIAAPWCNWGTGRGGGYASFCGTSAATPAIAGIAGLAFSYNPAATNGTVEQALESSTVAIVGSHTVQYGRVDAYRSLLELGPAPAGTPPAATALPAVTGIAEQGQTLTASAGAWSGSTPMGFAYHWRRCDLSGAACLAVAGATSQGYVLGSADVGSTIMASVTASNAYGSSTASSAATAIVTAAPPTTTTTTATFTGSLSKKQQARSYDLVVGAGQAAASLQFTRASTLTLTLRSPDGSTVGSASGPSAVQLVRSLPSGSYTYVVSGSTSASFTLTTTYTTP
jgi:subtilisin family serine protease